MHTLPQFECILQSGIKNLPGSNTTLAYSNTTLTSKNSSIYSHRNENLVLIEISVQCIIFGLAVIGNTTVLFLRRPFVRCEWMNDSNVPVNGRHH
jgi:hypothetical protein